MDPARFRPPVSLRGRYVDLDPLAPEDAEGIAHAARDPEVSRLLVLPPGSRPEVSRQVIATLLARQQAGTDLPFTTRLRSSGAIVGMTRFLHIEPAEESVEIGGTFVDSAYWRSPVNTDAKLAMLRYAFEEARVHRVTLQTDERNTRSQAAIARLGAVREGVHREDRRFPNGYYRSSVFFSILASEWPSVLARLSTSLERPWDGRGASDRV